jgi:hypothetical protein
MLEHELKVARLFPRYRNQQDWWVTEWKDIRRKWSRCILGNITISEWGKPRKPSVYPIYLLRSKPNTSRKWIHSAIGLQCHLVVKLWSNVNDSQVHLYEPGCTDYVIALRVQKLCIVDNSGPVCGTTESVCTSFINMRRYALCFNWYCRPCLSMEMSDNY